MGTHSFIKRVALTVLIVAVAAFYASTLLAYPPPTCDETTYASAGLSLLTRGTVGLTIFAAGNAFDRDVNSVQFGRIYVAGLAATFQLLGLSLPAARLFSGLGWLAAAGGVWLVGRRVWGQGVGLVAALLFATSSKAFLTAHLARPESWLAASLLGVVYLIICLTQAARPKPWQGFAFGLLALIPAHIHLLGFSFAFSLLLVVGIEFGVKRRQWQLFMLFCLGLLIGAAIWLWLHTGGALANLRQLSGVSLSPLQSNHMGNRWLVNLASLPGWFYSVFWTAGGPLSLVEAVAGIAGLWLAARQPGSAARLLAAIAVGALIPYSLIVPTRWIEYGVLWSPYWWLLGVGGLNTLLTQMQVKRVVPKLRSSLLLGPVVVASLVGANLLGDGWLVYRFRGSNFEQMAERIAAYIPPGSRVVADPVWWWALGAERVFLSEDYVLHIAQINAPEVARYLGFAGPVPGPQAATALFTKLQPDYVVLDEAMSCQTDPSEAWKAYRAVIQTECTPIGTIAGNWVNDPTKRTLQTGQVSTVYACQP